MSDWVFFSHAFHRQSRVIYDQHWWFYVALPQQSSSSSPSGGVFANLQWMRQLPGSIGPTDSCRPTRIRFRLRKLSRPQRHSQVTLYIERINPSVRNTKHKGIYIYIFAPPQNQLYIYFFFSELLQYVVDANKQYYGIRKENIVLFYSKDLRNYSSCFPKYTK